MSIRVNRDGTGDPALQSLLSARGLISLMAVPINISSGYSTQPEDRNILVAARPSGETPFSESDLEFFAILARQAGVALENAHLQSALRDYIHQVEESQRALILAEKMAIAGRLTASIAHEINNPLQSLQNCLHLASRSELSIEDRQGYLDLAHAELDRLMNTVQRMLDYYRPAAVDRQPIEINDLINRVLTLLDQQLRDHAIQLQVHLAAKLPEIWVVADQIQQVLLNLILNAMEAMPEGGNLYIYTRVYKDGIEIIVEDTGPGIDKNQRKRIFDPFFSTKERGTGLGLAISFGIVVAHGGSLDIIPGRGKGACFRMILPSREYA
jgi:two-component system NtrC family sensor kinase